MNSVFLFILMVLSVDCILTACRKKDSAAEKTHAVFSGIIFLIGIVGAVSVRFALSSALNEKRAAESYIEEAFAESLLQSFDSFAPLLTLLCLLTGIGLLWNGMVRNGQNQFALWIVSGTLLQILTLVCEIKTINAYFDAAIYMNSFFLFEIMVLHLVNPILFCLRRCRFK